jgi:tripartite-type tricarboxylate transporter receptor subunit TctC
MLRRTLLIGAAALLGAGMSAGTGAFAQESYPTRPITLVVPYAPGGATDIIGRVVAEEVSNTIGQRVIVENRPGAAGSLGAAAVSRADPDGYTLLSGSLWSSTPLSRPSPSRS